MKPAVWHPRARDEFAEAVLWYEEQAGNGQRFLREVDGAIERLRAAPQSCSPVSGVDDERIRRARVRGFRYHVVFLDRPRSVFVVAVAHMHRRPGYWKNRVVGA